MAGNLERLQEKLTGEDQKGYSIGPELDQHINAVIKNSRAVASISTDEYKKAIFKDCEEVKGQDHYLCLTGINLLSIWCYNYLEYQHDPYTGNMRKKDADSH